MQYLIACETYLATDPVAVFKRNDTAYAQRLHMALLLWLVTCKGESIHKVRLEPGMAAF